MVPTGLGNAKNHLFYYTFCIWSRPKSHPTRIRPVLVVWVRLGFVLDAFWVRLGSVLGPFLIILGPFWVCFRFRFRLASASANGTDI